MHFPLISKLTTKHWTTNKKTTLHKSCRINEFWMPHEINERSRGSSNKQIHCECSITLLKCYYIKVTKTVLKPMQLACKPLQKHNDRVSIQYKWPWVAASGERSRRRAPGSTKTLTRSIRNVFICNGCSMYVAAMLPRTLDMINRCIPGCH